MTRRTHGAAVWATVGKSAGVVLATALIVILSGCGTTDSGYSGADAGNAPVPATCEDTGLVTVEGEGCLSPEAIEQWMTSGCADRTYEECQQLGFPGPWEMDGEFGGLEASSSPSTDTSFLDKWGGGAASDSPQPEADLLSASGEWDCTYQPTYDYDWHNDIYCTDGVESDRPYLLPDDSYITESEIRDAAREHEELFNRS
ncbi:hypothetical protein OG801_27370 [Nocardioides sp. NBC_00163]|uniref:hypothetical protein n=1 Tax=Nocardioides sp. NBC_00163 TaxID=2975999 RepID=UPI003250704E